MYLWRLSIAVSLGLVWYFSDYGPTVTHYIICFLFCVSTTPLLCGNHGRESSTQTDEETKEHPLQETVEEESLEPVQAGNLGQNIPLTSQCPHVKKSLQQVFECAYAQLVLPWYGVPEPCEQQPLHKVLSRDFDFVIDRIIERARDFDVCQAVVSSIRILTQHLHKAKQPDRDPLFSSAALEMAFLRELSDALVRNLFPRSFWGQETYHCALNEMIALKGLGLLVNWLSDPDNLNQLAVNQLDSVALKSSAEELHASDPDHTSVAPQEGECDEEGSEVNSLGAEISTGTGLVCKRRGHRLREGWSKFVDKMKTKKAKKKKIKKMEQDLVLRIMAVHDGGSNEDDASSKEGSLMSQEDSELEDRDLDDYLASVQEDMMEFKLSYEMWRVGCWAVSIPHADWEDSELIFAVHLEEKDSPENLQWDIKKAYMDVVHFRNRWQDSTSLPTIVKLEESEVNNKVKEEATASVQHFLQELVSDSMIGHTLPVFQFLCPLDKLLNEEEQFGGVWGILSGLACFLTPGQEEEENSSLQTEVPKENTVTSPHPESSPFSVENHCESTPIQNGSPFPTIVVSQYNSPPQQPEEAKVNPQPAANADTSHENSFQEKPEDSDCTLTSHFKMMFRGKSRSQESLSSTKGSGDEEQPDETQQAGAEELSQLSCCSKSFKKERTCFQMSGGAGKMKGKETTQGPLQRGEDSQRGQGNWEQLESTKAIFDLLKEISGNSILINIFDAILKPVMPILKKKLNSFLSKLNPTEDQMAAYIDTLRSKLWPEVQQVTAPPPPRTDEEKKETRERAHDLISARYSNHLFLKKTDVESVFNIFQNREENKTLINMLLGFLLREFLPNEQSLPLSANVLQKVTNNAN
ncbi:uncharacterized protein si:rp71-46j2.7 [Girardinichthys multiradiatus]|uniref:uncharacterized protein si:rp71-46j2.7 n=1 Tax=Girardinichthys multiradiatus TaxID=208333 RepID=UPI001FADACFD|nr:uncharacterized protein si:rp71-46j2.7 [Girardinichthys multiradiatus]